MTVAGSNGRRAPRPGECSVTDISVLMTARLAEGQQLEQPEPGVLVWRTPAGRSYTTTPTRYAG